MKPRNRMQTTECLVIVAAIALFFSLVGPANAITWGWPDDGEHPNVGAIVADYGEDGLVQICSGTLIHPRVFLTAGHCTDYLESAMADGVPIYVNFEEYALDPSELHEVDECFTHPDYGWQGRSDVHDVGLLILKNPVSGITPATLPEEGFLDELKADGKLRDGKEEADFTVVGYGGTLYWPPPEIDYENVRQYAYSEFQALLKSWLIMSQNNATGDGGTAFGDSGGPTFWTEDGDEILVSVTSWGDARCVATGISYRIDTSDALEFIYENLP